MKANELMIDDWLEVILDNGKYKDYARVANLSDNGAIELAITGEPGAYWSLDGNDDIKPIPLTPEILEKNGFETVAQKAAEPVYWQLFDNETGNVVNAFRRIYRGLWVECSNATTESSANKQCEYVHELQQVLRLCEIEKEIVV